MCSSGSRRIVCWSGDDHAALLDSLQSSFRETENMIKQKAREFGIDIDEIAGGASVEEISAAPAGHSATMRSTRRPWTLARSRVSSWRPPKQSFPSSEREYLDDIAWHHTVVPAKVYRALGWRTEGAIADDAKGFRRRGHEIPDYLHHGLRSLASTVPELEGEGRRLSAAGSQLEGIDQKTLQAFLTGASVRRAPFLRPEGCSQCTRYLRIRRYVKRDAGLRFDRPDDAAVPRHAAGKDQLPAASRSFPSSQAYAAPRSETLPAAPRRRASRSGSVR